VFQFAIAQVAALVIRQSVARVNYVFVYSHGLIYLTRRSQENKEMTAFAIENQFSNHHIKQP
jgi:hypothetical protein